MDFDRSEKANPFIIRLKDKLKNPEELRKSILWRINKALLFTRNLPYNWYLKLVFPSGRWRRYYRHTINEYNATSIWPDAQVQHVELLKNLPEHCTNVLDLGCGDGWSTNYIKEALGKEIVGFTCSADELRFAKSHYPSIKIRFGDMHSLPFRKENFDAIYCRECYEHSIAPYIAMCEMSRVLRQNGYLLINVPDEKWIRHDSHFFVPNEAQMEEMLRKCRFKLLRKGRTKAGHFWFLAQKIGQTPGM